MCKFRPIHLLTTFLFMFGLGLIGYETMQAEAGPFARFRANRHVRIATRLEDRGADGIRYRWHTARATQIDNRQSRVETRRWGCVVSQPATSASTSVVPVSYVVSETVVSGGSSGSYGASAGSYGSYRTYSAPASSADSYGAYRGGSSGSYGTAIPVEEGEAVVSEVVVSEPVYSVPVIVQPSYQTIPRSRYASGGCFRDAFGRLFCPNR